MKLIPTSALVRYLHATRGFGPQQGESLLDAVALELCQELRIERGHGAARKFVESHREAVFRRAGKATRAASPSVQQREAERAPAALDPAFVMSDAFLESYEWRRVRMQVLKRDGARCECCGATPATGAVMNVDHIRPRRLFPELALDPENLQVLCNPCNHGKGYWDMTDWRKRAGDAVP